MYYTTEKRYERKHTDYKGVFENLQGQAENNHLIGKRTLMIQGCALIIESAGLEILPSWEHDMTTKGGKVAKYSYTDDWSRPVFDLELNSGKVIEVVFLEEGIYEGRPMHTLTGEGEPDCPLKDEYQVKAI